MHDVAPPPSRKRFTREDAETRRRALIEATVRALARYGAAGVSVRTIAREADVSAGLVAHHFGGVEALIAEAYRALAGRIGVAQMAAAKREADPRAALNAYVEASFRPPVLEPDLLATWIGFWGLTKTSGPVAEAHRDVYAAYCADIETLLAPCLPAAANLRMAAVAMAALIDGLWLELSLDGGAFTSDQAAAAACALINAWLPDAPPDSRSARASRDGAGNGDRTRITSLEG
ncbi:MAG TPA: TetR family transcriptional regulator C-terminal domain-containing protein [Sphingomonas sp.]|nr:TetR family transcriptional regulator C-terminal domain-containing protein [Sphingomonas sp.]